MNKKYAAQVQFVHQLVADDAAGREVDAAAAADAGRALHLQPPRHPGAQGPTGTRVHFGKSTTERI